MKLENVLKAVKRNFGKVLVAGGLCLGSLYSNGQNREQFVVQKDSSFIKYFEKQPIQAVLDYKEKLISTYFPLTLKEKEKLFDNLSDGLKDPLYKEDAKIFIVKEEDIATICGPGAGACVNPHFNRMVLPENFSKLESLHESAHMRHNYLNKIGSDFEKEWKKISNFNHNSLNNFISIANPLSFPREGMLTKIGSKNIYEDIVQFIEPLSYSQNPEEKLDDIEDDLYTDFILNEVMNKGILKQIFYNLRYDKNKQKIEERIQQSLNKNQIPKFAGEFFIWEIEFSKKWYPFYFADTTDKRYQQKLDLLKEYEFITEPQHKDLSSKLGSLHYLIKN